MLRSVGQQRLVCITLSIQFHRTIISLPYFINFFLFIENESQRENVLRLLLQALDECPLNSESFSRAAKAGIEAAICKLNIMCRDLSQISQLADRV